ncbi:MAG: Uma2 family endonuclease [Chloroflexota bacterium]
MSIDTLRLVPSSVLDPTYVEDEEQDEPLAGQDHRLTIDAIYHALSTRLAGPACFVAAELRVHRDPRNLRDYKEPDVCVALGVADGVRERYIIPDEGKAPDLVFEVLSLSSEENGDLEDKKRWYAQESVREYIVVDPQGKFAARHPRLQRFWLETGSGVAAEMADPDGVLRSRLLPFGFTVDENWVRVVDLASGELLPTPKESEQRRLAAEREAREALARAWTADLLAQEAQAQVRAAEAQTRAAEAQARAAEAQAQTADAQARAGEARATALEAELARLRRHLDERDSGQA